MFNATTHISVNRRPGQREKLFHTTRQNDNCMVHETIPITVNCRPRQREKLFDTSREMDKQQLYG